MKTAQILTQHNQEVRAAIVDGRAFSWLPYRFFNWLLA